MTNEIQLHSDECEILFDPLDVRRHVLKNLRAFIGMTASEIKESWKVIGVPASAIQAGKWDDTREPYLCISLSNVGAPLVDCTFDKAGHCSSQSYNVLADDVIPCSNRIRSLGFSYSARNKRWTKPETPYTWRFQLGNFHQTILIRRFKTIKNETPNL